MSRADEPRRTQRTVTPGNITVAQREELLRQRQLRPAARGPSGRIGCSAIPAAEAGC
ncbi:hypothetical protein M3B43_05860 [Nesterenkonia massiliensis]|uniref:Uncharacterized protein n=1 Tax=Nesterenkonia massiliensis TaxID=1232429 RepID=A0ABT2HQA1_9MICC|nr:hypothetical protein [Nesterenkonia massiliensis]MCT1606856.1 hypothetical protein [Nesterenkonia massiliensis]